MKKNDKKCFSNGKKQKVIIITLILIVLLGFSTNAYAASVLPPDSGGGSGGGCVYESTHGKHNPHADNMEFKIYVWPDYSVGQMLHNSFYACKGCNYCCCIVYQHFGNLITNSSDSEEGM